MSSFLDSFRNTFKKFTTIQIIFTSFLFVIFTGATLLMLPISVQDKPLSFIDALFTSTSAVCVTGLVIFPTYSSFSLFGQIIIIILIQIGGLGLMSLVTVTFIFLGKKISLKDRLLIKDSFNIQNLSDMSSLLKYICVSTFIVEGVGAIILFIKFLFIDNMPFLKSLWFAIFHSISAFCNAGFDIIGEVSLMDYKDDYIINIVIMSLICLGGLGFTVWSDFTHTFFNKNFFDESIKSKFHRLTLHSRLAMITTFFMILIPALFFMASEFDNPNTIKDLPIHGKIIASFFQSVTLRTAGYATLDQGALNPASKFVSILLMFIGGSPGSTAGGVKTTTFVILIVSTLSLLKSRDSIVIFNKKVAFEVLQNSIAVFMLNSGLIVVSTILLCFTDNYLFKSFEFIDVLFEITSAVGTVGLTTGFTHTLTLYGKIIIIVCMFIGRIGSVTFLLSLGAQQKSKNTIHYPEEKILVG